MTGEVTVIANNDIEPDAPPWNERSPRLETYRVVFSREMRSLAAVGGSEGIGGLRDYTRGGRDK